MPPTDAPLTAVDLAAIAARCEAATMGPWSWGRIGDTRPLTEADWHGALPIALSSSDEASPDSQEPVLSVFVLASNTADLLATDAEFIAHAREDVPRLLAEVQRRRAGLERMRTEFRTAPSAEAILLAVAKELETLADWSAPDTPMEEQD